MPTRKELLEELRYEIEHLSDTVTDGSDVLAASHEALEKHGQTQLQAAEVIFKGLDKVGGDIIAAMFVGGFAWLMGKAIVVLIERIREINKKTDMIKSIQKLQAKYSHLSYEFIVERSFAGRASKDERQSILNELIHDEIVTTKESESGEVLSIEPDNPKLIEYWEWLDSIRETANKEHQKFSRE
jgi:hypothetical protein